MSSSSSSSSSSASVPTFSVPEEGPDNGVVGSADPMQGGGASGPPPTGPFIGQLNRGPCPPAESAPPGTQRGSGGVRAYNGAVVLTSVANVQTQGLNFPFGTQMQYDSLVSGGGWKLIKGLRGLEVQNGAIVYREGVNSIKVFVPTTGGNYQATYFVQDRLFFDGTVYKLTSPNGAALVFDSSRKLTSFQNAGGNSGSVTYNGTEVDTVTMTQGLESWQFVYAWSGGRLANVIFKVNGTSVRQVVYGYDGSGHLTTIKVFPFVSGAWGTEPVEAARYSYHTSGAASGLLRHVVTPIGWRQMVANGITDPGTASDTVLNDYAETEYLYDANLRVQTMYTRGRTYAYTFIYTAQSQASNSLNVWTAKTAVGQPDGSTVTYYFNRAGQVILRQVSTTSPAKTWNVISQKFEEDTGRLIQSADAAAIQTVNEGSPTLVTLQASLGLVKTFTYTSGGWLYQESVKQGYGWQCEPRAAVWLCKPDGYRVRRDLRAIKSDHVSRGWWRESCYHKLCTRLA